MTELGIISKRVKLAQDVATYNNKEILYKTWSSFEVDFK